MSDRAAVPIAATPPMGWNSWNGFGPAVNAEVVRATADALVETGLRDAGYRYIVIDDGWQAPDRDAAGDLVPDPDKFPDGMKPVADCVHDQGMKFGIYSGPGPTTCWGRPASYGHERRDVERFVSWEVDYLKYDECSAHQFGREKVIELYRLMGGLLRDCGREIVLSISTVDRHKPWLWASDAGAQLWRTTRDILDYWRRGPHHDLHSIDSIGFEQQQGLAPFAGPGRWNDPDMLVVGLRGRGHIAGDGCTDLEYRTHFALWCMLAAPLMIGAEIGSLDPDNLATLGHPEIVAIDQDPLGRPGERVRRDGRVETWIRPLAGGDSAVAFFNRGGDPARINLPWHRLGITRPARVRDLWARTDLDPSTDLIRADLPPHDHLLLRITPGSGE